MAFSVDSLKNRTWNRGNYVITTNPDLISVSDINAAFASKEMYWAIPLPEDVMRAFIDHNLCFGVYSIPPSSSPIPATSNSSSNSTTTPTLPSSTFIGFARLMTDFVTMAYVSDVYILPAHQGQGLGRWLLACIQETLATMPYLRGSMLFTGDWNRSVPLYEELLGMSVVDGRRVEGMENGGEGFATMLRTWKGSPLFEEEGRKADEKN